VRNRIKTIAVAALASALTVAGLAVAHDDDGGGGEGGKGKRVERAFGPPPGGPGPLLAGGRGALTYSETHLREDGEDVVVRADKGKVTAVDDDSIAIERNDGETLDVPVDDDTHVLAGLRRRDTRIDDIPVGKAVIVVRKGDEAAAELVAVVPKRPFVHRLRMRG
jgi:hypothetical protein